MCKIEANQKKAIALALQMEGEVWAAYEELDGKDAPRDLTTIIVCFKRVAKSYGVTRAGDLRFEKRRDRFTATTPGDLKAMFGLPFGRLCWLENCN